MRGSVIILKTPMYVGGIDKPARFDQAAKDCIATLYAPVSKMTVVSESGRRTDRSGKRYSATRFVEYVLDASGHGWNLTRQTSRRF